MISAPGVPISLRRRGVGGAAGGRAGVSSATDEGTSRGRGQGCAAPSRLPGLRRPSTTQPTHLRMVSALAASLACRQAGSGSGVGQQWGRACTAAAGSLQAERRQYSTRHAPHLFGVSLRHVHKDGGRVRAPLGQLKHPRVHRVDLADHALPPRARQGRGRGRGGRQCSGAACMQQSAQVAASHATAAPRARSHTPCSARPPSLLPSAP